VATPSEIEEVRQNVSEPTPETWGDDDIGLLIDELGVDLASARIWRKKAAGFAELVDVSEAGSSHGFSDLQGKALKMAEMFEVGAGTVGAAKVHVIERE
jgi:hypothetical protein